MVPRYDDLGIPVRPVPIDVDGEGYALVMPPIWGWLQKRRAQGFEHGFTLANRVFDDPPTLGIGTSGSQHQLHTVFTKNNGAWLPTDRKVRALPVKSNKYHNISTGGGSGG